MSPTTHPEPRPDRLPYDCVVISDLHLGSDVCQASLLEEFLEWAVDRTRELVINGDIFNDLNFKRLNKRHFACLRVIRRNSDRDDLRLVWIRGNHDGPAEIVGHIVGVEVLDEYVYRNGRLELLILHGDQFDNFITRYKALTALACGVFYYIQRWAPHGTARWIRRISKKWQRNSRLIAQRATEYARGKGFQFVTCGHTHMALVERRNDVLYVNSGTWTEHPPCPFVAVRDDRVWLETWPPDPGAVMMTPGLRVDVDSDPEAEAGIAPEPADIYH